MRRKDGKVTIVKHKLESLFVPAVVEKIREIVPVFNRITTAATVLINMHLRSLLDNPAVTPHQLKPFLANNTLRPYFNAVTHGNHNADLRELYFTLRDNDGNPPPLETRPTANNYVTSYICEGLATTAKTNIHFHLRARVKSVVNRTFRIDNAAWHRLTREQRAQHKRNLELVRLDVLRPSDVAARCSARVTLGDRSFAFGAWTTRLRVAMRIGAITRASIAALAKREEEDEALPGLVYYAKCRPEEFLVATRALSERSIALGGRGYSLFPLRRSGVPKYLHLDSLIIATLDPNMSVDRSDEMAVEEVGMGERMRKRKLDVETDVQKAARKAHAALVVAAKKRIVFESAMLPEAFKELTRARASGKSFDFAVKTDGFGASVQMLAKAAPAAGQSRRADAAVASHDPSRPPTLRNGRYSVAEFRDKYGAHYHTPAAEGGGIQAAGAPQRRPISVVAIDPGKREIISAVDVHNPDNKYTFRKSHQDHVTGSVRYRQGMAARTEVWDREHALKVKETEVDLAAASSNAVPLDVFRRYASKLVFSLAARCPFYEQPIFRTRSRKRALRKQSLFSKVVNRLRDLPDRTHPVVLAYGSWGARTSGLRFRGTPPTIGVGFMNYLARFFPVVITPEHFTSSICLECDGRVSRCQHAEEARANSRTEHGRLKEIRGLRFCAHCNIHFNRDHLGARNIGRNFCRMYNGQAPIRVHSPEEEQIMQIQSQI